MQHNQIIRKPELRKMTGLSDSSIWRREQEGTFPLRRSLGGRAVGWFYDEVLTWLDGRESKGVQ